MLDTLLLSAVVAVIVSSAFEVWFRKQDKENKRFENLYGPLKFHLMTINVIDKNIARIINAGDKAHKNIKEYRDIGSDRFIELSQEIFRSEAVIRSTLLKKWWFEVDQISDLFKAYPDQIKAEDMALIRKKVVVTTIKTVRTAIPNFRRIRSKVRTLT